MRVFTGYDPREREGWEGFVESLMRTSTGFELMPRLSGPTDGSNAFTLARFNVPKICHWGGAALFLDACDMILRANIKELFDLFDPQFAVQVVKHDYKTKHPRKYVGSEMEAANTDYERKNWSSLILFNAGHPVHFEQRHVIDQAIAKNDGSFLHRFKWMPDRLIGELPIEWGWMPDEYGPNENAKLLHWTAGAPFIPHYRNAPMAEHWHSMARTIHSER